MAIKKKNSTFVEINVGIASKYVNTNANDVSDTLF